MQGAVHAAGRALPGLIQSLLLLVSLEKLKKMYLRSPGMWWQDVKRCLSPVTASERRPHAP